MNLDRFRSEDWPMLPHSEPENYPDDWEQIKPKTLLKESMNLNLTYRPCRICGESTPFPISHCTKDLPADQQWVETDCTNPCCSGLKETGTPYKVRVPKGREKFAKCSECFCR